MATVKVGRDGSGNCRRSGFFNPLIDDREKQEKLLREKDRSDDSDDDDDEFAEVECEIIKFHDQKCNVPFDLYDLGSLKEVLSLEAWNSCLNEEERFSLSAYLPDMDREIFWLTMKELLSGENVFFGSPLEVFFQRLKGGLYSLKVSQFREVLKCIQKRNHYHSLRLYHENMARTFMDMKKAWNHCQSSIDVEERIRIWNKRRVPKPVCVVDLNAFPVDDDMLTIDKNFPSPLPKQMKSADNGIIDNHYGEALSLPKAKPKPKGVLKIKSASNYLESSSTVQSLPCDSWGKLRPKGVLKIKFKSEPRPEGWISQEPVVVETSSLSSFRFSPQRYGSTSGLNNVHDEPYTLYQKAFGAKLSGSSELTSFVKGLPEGQLMKGNIESFSSFQNLERIRPQKVGFPCNSEVHCIPMKDFQANIYSHDIHDVRNCKSGDLGQTQYSNSWTMAMGLYPNLTELNTSALVHYQEKNLVPLVSGVTLGTSLIDAEESGSLVKPFDQVEHKHRDICDKGLLKSSEQTAGAGIKREGFMLPLTYKRKKVHLKHNSVGNTLVSSGNSKGRSKMVDRSESHLVEEAKSVKIKLKMWNSPDSQHKQGLLNGL